MLLQVIMATHSRNWDCVCVKISCDCLTDNEGCQWQGLRDAFWFHQLRVSEKMVKKNSWKACLFCSGEVQLPLCRITKEVAMFLFLGRTDHAGPAADPRTDCHVAPGAATEHPHSQRADSEDCRSTVRIQLMKALKKAKTFPINVITSNTDILEIIFEEYSFCPRIKFFF